MLKRLLAGLGVLLALSASLAASPSLAGPVRTGHLSAELAAAAQGVAPGGEVQLVMRQVIDKGWHTYWRNSGDSGAPTELTWTLPAGWSAGDIVWAPPSRKPIGPLMNYGYSGEVLLPVTVQAPASARPGDTVTLQAKAAFLVCADVCIPEDADLSLDIKVVTDAPPRTLSGRPVSRPPWRRPRNPARCRPSCPAARRGSGSRPRGRSSPAGRPATPTSTPTPPESSTMPLPRRWTAAQTA